MYGPSRVEKKPGGVDLPFAHNFDPDAIQIIVQPPRFVYDHGKMSSVLPPGPQNKDRYEIRDLSRPLIPRPQSAPSRRQDTQPLSPAIEVRLGRPVSAVPAVVLVSPPTTPVRPQSAPVARRVGGGFPQKILSHPSYREVFSARTFRWAETLRDFRAVEGEKCPIMSRRRTHLRKFANEHFQHDR